ncbi:Digestive cysteine proteinase 3 [Geodia barretti]|uniref:Digestive cysteine proteinase 3 n=1 Tax=Geodia barretti TaxID=519541 RepID=A0AA35SMP6_GEOBA|nr:Digestive cysteine proteinase 3 [Geodia barretti]
MRDKQRFLWLLVVIVVVEAWEGKIEHPEEWDLWKTEHGKSYESQREELERHLVWLSNREYINAHNKNSVVTGFSLRLNHFADLMDEEFQEVYLTYRPGDRSDIRDTTLVEGVQDLPLMMDWRTRRAVTNIKEQGQCGSSYAFSAAGAVEGAWAVRHEQLVNISAQNIIDCSGDYGNDGCNGGNMKASFRYMVSNRGINGASHYPYKARFYYRGVYRSQRCSASNLTHAMLIIGYGTTNQRDYWLVKTGIIHNPNRQSWGVYWGVDGYILMARNLSNECGIASDASFPTLN